MHYFLKTLCGAALLVALGFPLNAQNSNFQLRSSITYPGQTLANICGWTSPDGHEYALIGAQKGLIITDITNPEVPVQIVQIPGPNNLWKEIKTYSHYAYVTSEGGGGVQIVDLSALPSATLQYHNYVGNGGIPEPMNEIHALHIDVKKGFLYTYGGNLSSAAVHDLNSDPYNPTYVGRFNDLGYIHDGYAENDTLYACHIYTGLLSIVDMSDKSNPVILGSVQTPGKFTHNSWLLADHKHILTTDETTPSFVTSYDISDPTDIKELDRFSIDNGEGSYGHNVQVINDWTVTSWYTGGVVVTDCHRPENLVKTAHYDTWAGTGAQFDGCWGAYPYFPSGTVIASNIDPGQLFILTPNYIRACYLEGIVRDGCDGQPLSGATVEILNGDAGSTDISNNLGIVRTGQVTPGIFTVRISKAGYITQTFEANLVTAEVAAFDITLQATAAYNITGQVNDESGQPVSNLPVTLSGNGQTFTLMTNANGQFNADCVIAGNYLVATGVWGHVYSSQININSSADINITLEKKYYDNFNSDFGWTSTNTSPSGLWTLGEPVGTDNNGSQSNPEEDVPTDVGDQCYLTGNGGGNAGSDDVDGGNVILTSPAMELSTFSDAILTFSYWFLNAGGSGTPNDHFEARVSNGITEVVLLNSAISASQWKNAPAIHLGNFITLTDNVKVSFYTADDAPGHLVEAAVDVFSVVPVAVNSTEITKDALFTVSPNPSSGDFFMQYAWPGVGNSIMEVRNAVGQVVLTQSLSGEKGNGQFGASWPAGIYMAYITNGNQTSTVVKLVKN
jgi:choice-of-anchor B domain-containing protein